MVVIIAHIYYRPLFSHSLISEKFLALISCLSLGWACQENAPCLENIRSCKEETCLSLVPVDFFLANISALGSMLVLCLSK